MAKFKTMTVTELDRLYWETYSNMHRCKDQRTYREYCETGAAIMKELESRGIITPSDICNAIKRESLTI